MTAENKKVFFSSFKSTSVIASFAQAMEFLRKNPRTDLIIEPGEYVLSDEMSIAAQKNVMTGKYGSNPQKIMFNPDYKYTVGIAIRGLKNCSIIAENVKLIVDGFMEPISIKNCADVTVSGFEISHKRKPYSRGTVREVTDNRCLVEFDSDCPVFEKTPLLLRYFFCEADSDIKIMKNVSSVRFIDSLHVELTADDLSGICKNMLFYTVHTFHSRPAILIENSENITLDGAVIHNQPGMGIVGNRSENITIKNLKVIPESGHHLSTNTDATHFTSMKGKLCLENCIADGQGDDFTNIHSYYQVVTKKTGDRTYRIRENTPDGTHSQSIDYPDIGDVLELTEHKTLKTVGKYRVIEAEILSAENCCEVTLDRPLPDNTEGLVLSDVTRLPEVEITGCICKNHFARGILIKCRKSLIKNNEFYNIMGPAIEIAAEAWWYEGVTPSNAIIEDNRIENCGVYWGDASGVVVKNDCEDPSHITISNVRIEHNVIDSPKAAHGIYCRNTEGLVISDNMIYSSAQPVEIENCVLGNSHEQ